MSGQVAEYSRNGSSSGDSIESGSADSLLESAAIDRYEKAEDPAPQGPP